VLVDLQQRGEVAWFAGCFRCKIRHSPRESATIWQHGRAECNLDGIRRQSSSRQQNIVLGGRVMMQSVGLDPDRLDIQRRTRETMGACGGRLSKTMRRTIFSAATKNTNRGCMARQVQNAWPFALCRRGNDSAIAPQRVGTGQSCKEVIKGGWQLTGLRSANNC